LVTTHRGSVRVERYIGRDSLWFGEGRDSRETLAASHRGSVRVERDIGHEGNDAC